MKNHKRLMLLLPALLLSAMLAAAPAANAARPQADGTEEVSTEQELRFALSRDSHPKLTKDIKLTSCLQIEGTTTILMEGKRLYREMSESADDGHVIEVMSGADLTITNTAKTASVISGGNAAQGGGILNHGTLKMENVTVKDNKAGSGGGIMSNGRLELTNVRLENNTAPDGEGGNLLSENTATLENVTVSGGEAEAGGGIFIRQGMSMKNVTVKGNTSYSDGGGILNHGVLIINGSALENNTSEAGGSGGNLWTDALAELRGVTVSGGYARDGGGIAALGTLILSDCSVTDNEAAGRGGAVFFNSRVSGREMYLQDKNSFTGNKAWGGCGGVCVAGESLGDLYMKDQPEIKDNKQYFGSAHNLYLEGAKKIHFNGQMSPDAFVRLSLQSGKGVFTAGVEATDVRDVFHGENDEKIVEVNISPNAETETIELHLGGYMATLITQASDSEKTKKFFYDIASVWSAAFEEAGSSESCTISLEGDCETASRLVAASSGVTLDLNGYMLTRTGADNSSAGEVITVRSGASFTIEDSSPKRRPEGRAAGMPRGGVITGGSNKDNGGGITVAEDSTLSFNSGTLYRNHSHGSGGAVYVKGTLSMNGGTVTENSCDNTGGGIHVDKGGSAALRSVTLSKNTASHGGAAENLGGTLTLSGCTLTSNTAAGDGGAVEIRGDSKKTVIANSKLRGNTARDRGGAVYVNSDRLFIADCDIQFNRAPAKRGGGIYVAKGRHISIQGLTVVAENMELTDGAPRVTNIALAYDSDKNQAFIQNAGLTEGTRIGLERVNTDGKAVSSNNVRVVKDSTAYQNPYFFSDSGTLSFKETGDKSEVFMATSVRPFGYAVYPLLATELVIAAAVLTRARMNKKEKEAMDNKTREGEDS